MILHVMVVLKYPISFAEVQRDFDMAEARKLAEKAVREEQENKQSVLCPCLFESSLRFQVWDEQKRSKATYLYY
jgi:hypothetical protein